MVLKENIIEKYYQNKHTYKVPILFASECLTAFERILEDLRKENPYATISELFDE